MQEELFGAMKAKEMTYDDLASALQSELGSEWGIMSLRAFAAKLIINGECPRYKRRYTADHPNEPRYRALAKVLGVEEQRLVAWALKRHKHKESPNDPEHVQDEPCDTLGLLLLQALVEYASENPAVRVMMCTQVIMCITQIRPDMFGELVQELTVTQSKERPLVEASDEYALWLNTMGYLAAAVRSGWGHTDLSWAEASPLMTVFILVGTGGLQSVQGLRSFMER